MARRRILPGALFAAAFAVGAVGALLVADLLHGTAPEPDFAFGEPQVAAGFRRVNDTRLVIERVVEARVPWTYSGEPPARFFVTLLVADDPGFDFPVGTRTHDLLVTKERPSGVLDLATRVRGGGTFHWVVTATPVDGQGADPVAVEGTVRFEERSRG